MTDTQPSATPDPADRAPRRRPQRPASANRAPRSHPVLEQLAALYPPLFGAVFLPLKRGIFHDIQAAHPGQFEKDALKAALALHTRSTRYLSAAAQGLPRHDLQGQPVEPMATEHVYHALHEVYRRRQSRSQDDLRPALCDQVLRCFDASDLGRDAFATLLRSRDETANAVLDEVLAVIDERAAKDEALLRAFEASGKSMDAFADMYGLHPLAAAHTLMRARAAAAHAAASAPPAAD